MNYDYGKCHACDGQMTEQQTKQFYWIKETPVVIENVPAGVCSRCGEKVVKADVGRRLAMLLADSKDIQPTHNINVPVFEFKEVA